MIIRLSDNYDKSRAPSKNKISKSKFVSLSLPEFWIAMKKQYPIIADKAIRTLIPFASSYLCEMGFSALAVIKISKKCFLLLIPNYTSRGPKKVDNHWFR
ncbi:Uncharacterized protein FWK35_00000918 [Aphis craccivora]|uniref:Zinc finger BED domain-containing protein 5 n=1 Tax=Aphis craccivora TaxID=307492 RepID=A0A6G0ZFR4_APHCR|nr:Uncharacterized protein FWK35_00000918 [Aphis craccivora]